MTRRVTPGNGVLGLDLNSISEADWQRQVVEIMNRFGWQSYHTHNSQRSMPGFPDLVALHPATGDILVTELKRQRGKPTPAQLDWLGWFTRSGIDAYLWRPADIDAALHRLRNPHTREAIEPQEDGDTQ